MKVPTMKLYDIIKTGLLTAALYTPVHAAPGDEFKKAADAAQVSTQINRKGKVCVSKDGGDVIVSNVRGEGYEAGRADCVPPTPKKAKPKQKKSSPYMCNIASSPKLADKYKGPIGCVRDWRNEKILETNALVPIGSSNFKKGAKICRPRQSCYAMPGKEKFTVIDNPFAIAQDDPAQEVPQTGAPFSIEDLIANDEVIVEGERLPATDFYKLREDVKEGELYLRVNILDAKGGNLTDNKTKFVPKGLEGGGVTYEIILLRRKDTDDEGAFNTPRTSTNTAYATQAAPSSSLDEEVARDKAFAPFSVIQPVQLKPIVREKSTPWHTFVEVDGRVVEDSKPNARVQFGGGVGHRRDGAYLGAALGLGIVPESHDNQSGVITMTKEDSTEDNDLTWLGDNVGFNPFTDTTTYGNLDLDAQVYGGLAHRGESWKLALTGRFGVTYTEEEKSREESLRVEDPNGNVLPGSNDPWSTDLGTEWQPSLLWGVGAEALYRASESWSVGLAGEVTRRGRGVEAPVGIKVESEFNGWRFSATPHYDFAQEGVGLGLSIQYDLEGGSK